MNSGWKLYLIMLFMTSEINSQQILYQQNYSQMTNGVLDRIEDGDKAVILVEELKRELIIPVRNLPEGSSVNTWFQIGVVGEEFEIVRLLSVPSRFMSSDVERDFE